MLILLPYMAIKLGKLIIQLRIKVIVLNWVGVQTEYSYLYI